MRRMAAVLLVAGGCASNVANVQDQPLFAAGWSGPPPHVSVQLAGAGAGADKQQRCLAAVGRAGAVVDARAGVQAVVTLEPAGNRLQIMSSRRGLVSDEPRPAWSVERLCDDALYALVSAIRGDDPSAERSVPTLPPMLRRPLSAPASGSVTDQPEAPPPLPTASGGSYPGPIP